MCRICLLRNALPVTKTNFLKIVCLSQNTKTFPQTYDHQKQEGREGGEEEEMKKKKKEEEEEEEEEDNNNNNTNNNNKNKKGLLVTDNSLTVTI